MFREREKGIFLTQNHLGTPQPFRLKTGQNAEITHANHIRTRRVRGAF